MNVATAKAAADRARGYGFPSMTGDALVALADEVDRLENQLESVRAELAATAARIAAWDETLAAVLPSLEQQMTPERPRWELP